MSNQPVVIGLSGKMRAGKTVTAEALAEKHGFVRLSFADALKREVIGMGFSVDDVRVTKPEPIRKLLQAYGQARRFQDPNYWLDNVGRSIRLCKPNTVFIIDDVRFFNEAAFVEEQGVLIRLERPGFDNTDTDESETALDDYPFAHVVFSEEGPDAVLDMIEHVEDVLWSEGIIE